MKNKNNGRRIQQREIVIREFSDDTFEIDGIAWQITVKNDEVDEAFSFWRKGLLKENSNFDNRLPKILKKQKVDEMN